MAKRWIRAFNADSFMRDDYPWKNTEKYAETKKPGCPGFF
jgi:hypothetical protein